MPRERGRGGRGHGAEPPAASLGALEQRSAYIAYIAFICLRLSLPWSSTPSAFLFMKSSVLAVIVTVIALAASFAAEFSSARDHPRSKSYTGHELTCRNNEVVVGIASNADTCR